MIDKSKQYRTRDGRDVRIYATDGMGRHPVHGAVLTPDGWVSSEWMRAGSAFANAGSERDLIETKPRIKRTIWVAMYEGYCTHSLIKPVNLGSDCIACVKVEIDCEHGEGL